MINKPKETESERHREQDRKERESQLSGWRWTERQIGGKQNSAKEEARDMEMEEGEIKKER